MYSSFEMKWRSNTSTPLYVCRHIVRFFSQYYRPALFTLVGLGVVGGIISLVQYYRYKRRAATA